MLNLRKHSISFLFLLLIRNNIAVNYCESDICNNTREHTLCKFQSPDPARHCIEYEKTIKNSKDKQAILDKLNSRRNKVANGEIRSLPPAQSMMKLDWSEELENSAQRWANQCVKHSVPDIKDTCRDLGQLYVGQNIATIHGETPGLTPLTLVDVWYMELLNVNASILPKYKPSVESEYSHYDYFTQLVWAESSQVGCGGVKFKERLSDSSGVRNRSIYRLVCNFAPGGNRAGEEVYIPGAPCSQCPYGATCDSKYKALCNSNMDIQEKKVNTENAQSVLTSNSELPRNYYEKTTTDSNRISTSLVHESTINEIPSVTEDDNNYKPFDYFSHLHEYVMPSLSTTTKKIVSCKDVMAIDDFVELLKKKLSSDHILKELLQTSKMSVQNGHIDSFNKDDRISALVNKIYSKKMPSTTTQLPQTDYVNSTLLVDLVEAVIFRSGDKERIPSGTEYNTQYIPYVSPVKIQAELAEVRLNSDFTGHYFFPEDEEVVGSTSETTESYYDTGNLPVSDVVLEIEDIKRIKSTKDFLDEILESESTESNDNYNMINIDRQVHSTDKEDELRRNKRNNLCHGRCAVDCKKNVENIFDENVPKKQFNKILSIGDYRNSFTKYSELLKKIASDLQILKLNQKFHCLSNDSTINYFMLPLIIYNSILLII